LISYTFARPEPNGYSRRFNARGVNKQQIVGTYFTQKESFEMKSILKSMIGLPLTALIMTAAFVGPAALAGPVAADQQVPFKGSVQAIETHGLQFPTLFVNAIGTGTATQVGRFTLTYQVEVNLLTGGGPASIQLVAANGDTILGTGSGQGSPTQDPAVASIVETYTITGGTGRFTSVTGSFTVQRLVNSVTGITFGSFDGTIVIQ
jgi:hypothetical protein